MIRKSKKNQKTGQGALFDFINIPVSVSENKAEKETNEKPLSVSAYIKLLNAEFKKHGARIQGEISSLDIRDTYLFFSLKDKNGEGLMSCFMWKRNYDLCGADLEIGMEIIADGLPEIYAPSGRFNFRVSAVELVGEGALKKAYDALRKKLEREGIFSVERKKTVPEFPVRIGLITSETGAVIHDFLNNLGKYGYHISFVNSRVEGQLAVRSLLSAIKYFKNKDIDVLVIIRGGGSLESLQAFNNEVLVREIADFEKPVICGIGHDKDVPLASLAADIAVSTPTAVTTILNRSWEKAAGGIATLGKDLFYNYRRFLDDAARRAETYSADLIRIFSGAIENKAEMLDDAERRLLILDPTRPLKLGYSIVYKGGKVIKNIKQIKIGDKIDIRVSDGNINSMVEGVNK